ncbi:MAG: cytidylate kinase-like family protein [Bacteroidales bacterium]|nr:cytidylate kinase-like family protein [Bacteroidales bacterium]
MEKKIIINVGRQFGSGGKEVAIGLGKRLGIPVYDNELISKAAQDSGFSPELFRKSDEKRRPFSISSMFTGTFEPSAESYVSDKGLFQLQSEAIRHIAELGSAIIVGRCSDYILRDMGCTLDVFLTAPEQVRIGRIVERTGLSDEKAGALITSMDRNRSEYYNYYTFGNWGVASNYDLCLDTSILGIDGTADFIIEFARKAGLIEA